MASRFIVDQAKTHRRGGLKVATERFTGSTLYGWLVSPYTAKVRAHLAYKGVPFQDSSPSALQLFGRLQPAIGRLIMPTMKLSDGTWRQDSALICDEIDAEHTEPSSRPSGATQHLASMLLELHADEWLPMLALHHRWDNPVNAAWAQSEFGRCAFPLLPRALSGRLAKPMADRMRAIRSAQYGRDPATHDGIQSHARLLVRTLEEHLAAGSPYLLGGRACRGDFALYGPLWAHLYRDPFWRGALFGDAPHVVSWMERLHGHTADPAFPELASRPAAPPAAPDGRYLPSDAVPEALDPIFRAIFAEQWVHLIELWAALDAHLDEAARETVGGGVEEDVRAPRALGAVPFQVGGCAGERRLLTYSAWRTQRPLDLYATLQLAPSRELELASVNRWLTRIGAMEAFASLRPRWRIERDWRLPSSKEKFRATRVQ